MENILRIDKPTREDAFSSEVEKADKVSIKLTPKQNMIIFCLQNDWFLITANTTTHITCAGKAGQFEFSNVLFWRLYNMGLIYQITKHPFEYILTDLGKKCITKKVDIR